MNMKMAEPPDVATLAKENPVGEEESTGATTGQSGELNVSDQPITSTSEFTYETPGFDSDLYAACSSTDGMPMYGPMPRPSLVEDTSYGKDLTDLSAEQGVVGLYNLGNTCFMNSGLQCLMSIPKLVRYFNRDFDETLVPCASLSYQFGEILTKVWSGNYTLLFPKEFKSLLGTYHPQFQDYRQHDCQEFLALLLDTLHEQLNEGSIYVKALDESSKGSEAVGGRQQSVQSEDSEICESATHSGVHTPADRSRSQSPIDQMDNTNNSNIVHSLSSKVAQETAPNVSQYISEDSNQSETRSEISYQSSEVPVNEDHEQRMKAIPEEIKQRTSPSDASFQSQANVETMSVDIQSEAADDSNNAKTGGKDSAEKSLSLEDFYMKDTKTLNLNVVADDYMHQEIATDSEKFHKHDNFDRPSDPFETLSDFLMNEVKSPTSKPLKDSNLLANFKEKFDPDNEAFPKKCLFSDIKNLRGEEETEWDAAVNSTVVTGFCSINNIKRMKIDEDEKNVRMQARLKVNTNKNAMKTDESSNIRLLSPGDQSRGEGDMAVRNANALRTAETATSPLEEQMRAQNLAEAERAWKKYLKNNRSIIVDTFQGQFKSTVVCSECEHVSVTYEPFMYLSVPLPNAMERQISVIFLPSDNKQPIRYLLTLNKTSNIKKLKAKLLELIEEESADIVLAEVFDKHISKILDDSTMLRYINDYNRTIYAFEMLPPPIVDDVSGNISDDTSTITTSDATSHGSTDTLIGATNNCTVSSGSRGVDMDTSQPCLYEMTSSLDDVSSSTSGVHRSASEPTFVTNNHKLSTTSMPDNKELDSVHILNNFNSEQGWDTGFDSVDTPSSPTRPDNHGGFLNNFTDNMCTSSGIEFEVKKDEEEPVDCDQDFEVTSTSGNYGSSTGGTPQQDPLEGTDLCVGGGLVADSWKSCAICLEEMTDSELMVHTACGGTLCQPCLEMSYKHYGESSFMCPVCSSPVHPADDFVQLSDAAGYKPKTRILSVPIVYRNTVQCVDAKPRTQLFGHPNIMYLPSNTTGENLYDTVDRVVPCYANYSIVLTDGQGLHCSRCIFTAPCNGCEVPRTGELSLQPGDHLAVCFINMTPEQMDVANTFIDHKSMHDLRKKEYLTLFDCFDAFTDSETLDEHNPWYCPQCKRNQCARKTITVWRYPETLVVYLKRFVFHELSSSKIDNKVIFPTEDLDLSDYISGPITNKMYYDLQSCVCHFGGVNAGHYTSYAKHPVTKEWHYFNDENTTVQSPQDDDYSNAYVLFYQRQGTNIDLHLPEKIRVDSKPRTSVSEECASTLSNETQLDTNEVTSQLIKILQSSKDGAETSEDNAFEEQTNNQYEQENKSSTADDEKPGSSFEFYS